jgi:hypothetical protein
MKLSELAEQMHARFDRLEGAMALQLLSERKVLHMASDLETAVAGVSSVTGSVLTLIQGMADKVAATAGDPAKVQALVDELNADHARLAAAVAANTPASPVPAAALQPAAPAA